MVQNNCDEMGVPKGTIPWNKGKEFPQVQGDKNPAKRPEVRKKISEAIKGRTLSEECKKKISQAKKGKRCSPWTEFKKGMIPWNKGKKWGEDVRRKMSMNHTDISGMRNPLHKLGLLGKNYTWGDLMGKEKAEKLRYSHSNRFSGDGNPNWRGGISFEPYSPGFNDKLKEVIRKRDNYTCQRCGIKQSQLSRKLDIHHIDGNKRNNTPSNLIALCRSCNVGLEYASNQTHSRHVRSN